NSPRKDGGTGMRAAVSRPPRLTVALLSGALIVCAFSAAAQQQAPRSAQIKADLNKILSAPDFHATNSATSELEKMLKWLGGEAQKVWDYLKHLWDRLFDFMPAMRGSAGLQWVFIVLFLLGSAFLLSRLL